MRNRRPARGSAEFVLFPRAVLADARTWHSGAALRVRDGRIVELVDASRARRLRRELDASARVELADRLLTAGLVNAHAHLELTSMRARIPRGGAFTDWISALLARRARWSSEEWRASWSAGAARAVATGTTAVGDIDSSGAWLAISSTGRAPRVRVHRELLDAFDPARTPAALDALARPWPRASRAELRWAPALSPHAPHTVSDTLLDAIARRARRMAVPIGVHWSETQEELDWLERGDGRFARVLGASPRTRGLARLDSRGLVGASTALYHGNRARDDELELVRRRGATLVHCPGTHAFFDREPVDLAAWRRRGVRVALGTDSTASNDDLDLGREMRLARAANPRLAAADVWEMATAAGARCLGWERECGSIARGFRADLVAWTAPTRWTARAALDELTRGGLAVSAVWLGGLCAPITGSLTDTASEVW